MKPIMSGPTWLIIGTATDDAYSRTFDSGKTKATVNVKYDVERTESGEKMSRYINVEAWGELATYLSCIEKGDTILACGSYQLDEYRTQKRVDGSKVYKLVASFAMAQPTVTVAAEATAEQEPGEAFTEVFEDDGELPY